MTVTVANTLTTSTFDYWRVRTNELADAMTRLVISVNSNVATGNAHVNGAFSSLTLAASSIRGGNVSTIAALDITSNVTIATGNTLTVGNSSINVSINATALTIANNGFFTATGNSSFGNSSANVILNANGVLVQNTVLTVANTGKIVVGNTNVNVEITPSGVTTNGLSLSPISAIVNTRTTGTSTQLLDSFSHLAYRGGEYVLIIKDNGANATQMVKSMVLTNQVGVSSYEAYVTEYGLITSNTTLGHLTANANATHARLYFTPTVANAQIKGHRIFVVV